MKTKRSTRKNGDNRISVWLDHRTASLYLPGRPPVGVRVIASGIESRVRIPGESADGTRLKNYRVTNNEAHKNNLRQNQVRAFYKKLADALAGYDEIAITGPSTAGRELYNYLSGLKRFRDKALFVRKGAARAPKVTASA